MLVAITLSSDTLVPRIIQTLGSHFCNYIVPCKTMTPNHLSYVDSVRRKGISDHSAFASCTNSQDLNLDNDLSTCSSMHTLTMLTYKSFFNAVIQNQPRWALLLFLKHGMKLWLFVQYSFSIIIILHYNYNEGKDNIDKHKFAANEIFNYCCVD